MLLHLAALDLLLANAAEKESLVLGGGRVLGLLLVLMQIVLIFEPVVAPDLPLHALLHDGGDILVVDVQSLLDAALGDQVLLFHVES